MVASSNQEYQICYEISNSVQVLLMSLKQFMFILVILGQSVRWLRRVMPPGKSR